MLKLRLKRMGAPKKPFYRIVAIDDACRRNGRYIDKIGLYDPTKTNPLLEIDEAKVLDFLKQGAIPTETVKNLLQNSGIWKKYHESAK
ncbi:MAG: 30S ribosomal protein S16 [Candidatus Wallbacteria bacterium]|nr:30S ribosomal protein S16 [Candidatus Wallbacteria bacterium]